VAARACKPQLPTFTVVDEGEAPFNGHAVIGTAENLMVGRGADVAAALFYANRRITLKQGIVVLADSKDGSLIEPMARASLTRCDRANVKWLLAWFRLSCLKRVDQRFLGVSAVIARVVDLTTDPVEFPLSVDLSIEQKGLGVLSLPRY
jgi:hypothetical protein